MRAISLICIAAVMTGCASYGVSKRQKLFDASALAYERAIRWSDYRQAFTLAGNADATPPDLQRLQNVRVTSYDVLGVPQPNADFSRVVQVVEIRYVQINQMSERSLADQQTWVYSDKDERWRLMTPFPGFR